MNGIILLLLSSGWVVFEKMFIFFNVCLFLRKSMSRGGVERERETENPEQAPGSELSAQSLR